MRDARIFGFLFSFGLVSGLASGCGSDKPRGPAIVDASLFVDGNVGLDAAGFDAGDVDGGEIRIDSGSPEDAGDVDAGGPTDAGPPREPCTSAGAIEMVPCGRCGTVSRFCSAGLTWEYGVCGGEGECAPGTTESSACGMCGTQSRRCNVACTWEATGACSGEGECMPGATDRTGEGCPSGQLRERTCSASCVFETTAACSGEVCDTPGRLETVGCGLCGGQERFCNAGGTWEYGACSGEGTCMPGTTGTEPCGMCGTRTTRCTDTCTAVPFGECTGEGTCMPGQTTRTSAGCPLGQTRLLRCGDTCGYTEVAEACRSTVPVDVLFVVDATPSNRYDFVDEQATFVSRCVDALEAIPDVHVGLAWYGDLAPVGEVFAAGVELGAATSAAIDANITAQDDLGGADDSTFEALTLLTGGTPSVSITRPFACSAGRVAGGCWRSGAERIVVLHTDEAAKGGPAIPGPGLWNPWPSGASWTTVQPLMTSTRTKLFTILDDDYGSFAAGNPVEQYRRMVTDLGQPASDAYVVPSPTGLGTVCDSIVTRVRALAGL
jgi:hypothetical protein